MKPIFSYDWNMGWVQELAEIEFTTKETEYSYTDPKRERERETYSYS